MNSLKAYKLKKEEAEQKASFKKVCDSCVPDEYIELDNFILAVLEKLTDHCIESLEDLDQALEELENYQSAIPLMNEASIRVVEETTNKIDLFSMEAKTTYCLGNISDCYITKEQAELLEKVGINKIEVVNREE